MVEQEDTNLVVKGLQSKYSIILYKFIQNYQNVKIPEMTMEEFRKIFEIEKKYNGRINNLKAKVLDFALNEINRNDNIDFLVDYELKKTGKVYTHIKFEVKQKPMKIQLQELEKEKQVKEEDNEQVKEDNLDIITPEDAIGYEEAVRTEYGDIIRVRIIAVRKADADDKYLVMLLNDTEQAYTWITVNRQYLIGKARQKREKQIDL